MKIDLKKDKFEEIESCFTEIKEKRSNAGPACNKIETILSSVFHKKMKDLKNKHQHLLKEMTISKQFV